MVEVTDGVADIRQPVAQHRPVGHEGFGGDILPIHREREVSERLKLQTGRSDDNVRRDVPPVDQVDPVCRDGGDRSGHHRCAVFERAEEVAVRGFAHALIPGVVRGSEVLLDLGAADVLPIHGPEVLASHPWERLAEVVLEHVAEDVQVPRDRVAALSGFHVEAQPHDLADSVVVGQGSDVCGCALEHRGPSAHLVQRGHERDCRGPRSHNHHALAADIEVVWPALWVDDRALKVVDAGDGGGEPGAVPVVARSQVNPFRPVCFRLDLLFDATMISTVHGSSSLGVIRALRGLQGRHFPQAFIGVEVDALHPRGELEAVEHAAFFSSLAGVLLNLGAGAQCAFVGPAFKR